MSDKTVLELKNEAREKKIKGFSKMKRAELCQALGYDNCGKRVSKAITNNKEPKPKPRAEPKLAKRQSPVRHELPAEILNMIGEKGTLAEYRQLSMVNRGFYNEYKRKEDAFFTKLSTLSKRKPETLKKTKSILFYYDDKNDVPTDFSLLSNLKKLTILGFQAKTRIDKIPFLPSNLKTLVLNGHAIRTIENIPPTVTRLELFRNEIFKIENIPLKVKHLNLGQNKIRKIENIPTQVKELILENNPIQKLENLEKIKKLQRLDIIRGNLFMPIIIEDNRITNYQAIIQYIKQYYENKNMNVPFIIG